MVSKGKGEEKDKHEGVEEGPQEPGVQQDNPELSDEGSAALNNSNDKVKAKAFEGEEAEESGGEGQDFAGPATTLGNPETRLKSQVRVWKKSTTDDVSQNTQRAATSMRGWRDGHPDKNACEGYHRRSPQEESYVSENDSESDGWVTEGL